MAKIILGDREVEVEDGAPVKEACMELGVPFGCENGICGTCIIEITEGADNLNDLNEAEKDMEMDKKTRLACQCRIKSGEIKIKF